MVISRKESRSINPKKKPIVLNLDLSTLDIFCRYILQSHVFVKMEHLVNLRNLIYNIDPSTYENDQEKQKRFNFLFKGLEARIVEKLNDRDIVLNYINGGLNYKLDFIDYNRLDLSREEIHHIHNLVSETLKFKFMYIDADEYLDLLTRFKTCEFEDRGNIINEFENLLDRTKNNFRHAKVEDNATNMTFSLRDGIFENCITDTYNILTDPNRRLITGMQGFNEIVGGGLEDERVYMLSGTSGIGKSFAMLNIIYQIKKYNPHYKTKDPTKRPCILLLTMENTVIETIARLFSLINDHGGGKMSNYSLEDVIRIFREDGQLFLNDSSPIDIVIKYKPNKSVDTSFLYTLYDDLSDEGYEMILLAQDHIKRIRSVYNSTDLRIELGDVMNEFKTFAIDKSIPVLTVTHLNREATRVLEEAARKGNQDVGKLVGGHNIGESLLMIDNVDCNLAIAKDYDKDGNAYMCFNATKMRDDSARNYIAQPFAMGSKIRLLEDIGGVPQFKESIHMAPEMKRNAAVKTSGASSMYNFTNVLDTNEEKSDNPFDQDSYILESNQDIQDNLEDIKNILGIDATIQPLECPVRFVDESIESFKLPL